MTGWCQSDGRVVSGRLLIGFLIGFSRWVVSTVSVCLSHLRGSQWPGGMPGGVSIENGGMARVDWDCARGVGNQGAINGAFDASFAPKFCSTRRFLGALELARAGSCEKCCGTSCANCGAKSRACWSAGSSLRSGKRKAQACAVCVARVHALSAAALC